MHLLYNFLSFFFILCVGPAAFAQNTFKLPKQILNLSSDSRVATNALLADKSKRQLSLIDAESLTNGLIKEQYAIDIGKNNGDKKKRDDHRTPEGIYILLEKKTPPEIPFDTYGSMAFTTNYPNYFDKYENIRRLSRKRWKAKDTNFLNGLKCSSMSEAFVKTFDDLISAD